MTDFDWACCHWPGDALQAGARITKLETALQAIRSGPAAMLDYLQEAGAELPEMNGPWGSDVWRPECYEIEGDFAADARYHYPDQMSLIDAVCSAALRS